MIKGLCVHALRHVGLSIVLAYPGGNEVSGRVSDNLVITPRDQKNPGEGDD